MDTSSELHTFNLATSNDEVRRLGRKHGHGACWNSGCIDEEREAIAPKLSNSHDANYASGAGASSELDLYSS